VAKKHRRHSHGIYLAYQDEIRGRKKKKESARVKDEGTLDVIAKRMRERERVRVCVYIYGGGC
jgi:hypothetical protein